MISIKEIEKTFGAEQVLRNVSLAVADGTLVAVVGPSGAGKTTLLNIISGILTADTGSVNVITDRNRRLGYMLQEPALLPWRTLDENARIGLELIDSSDASLAARVDTLFLEFELDRSGCNNGQR